MIGMEKTNKIKIYHNNSCSKSCSALTILNETGQQVELIDYLKDVPSVEELQDIIVKLNCTPYDLIRKNEPLYLEKFKDKDLKDKEWIEVMHKNPILIQRPIIIKGDIAVLARSSDTLEAIINL